MSKITLMTKLNDCAVELIELDKSDFSITYWEVESV